MLMHQVISTLMPQDQFEESGRDPCCRSFYHKMRGIPSSGPKRPQIKKQANDYPSFMAEDIPNQKD